MDEEVVVTLPVLAERRHLVGESGAGLEHFHPDELGKTAIHRVRRDGRGAQAENLGKAGQGRQLVEAAQQHHVGRSGVRESLACLGDEAVDQIGGALGAGLEGSHGKGGPQSLRIGLTQAAAEAGAAQDEHEPVLLDGLHQHLDAGKPDVAQPLGQPDVHLGRDAPGPPVGDAARRVDGAEVPASGHVAGSEVELDAQRFEHTAAHRVAQRVITEEPEVPGATARCDARCHVAEQSAGGLGGERVEVRQARRFHLRLAGLQVGQPGQAVEGKQDDLRRVGDDEPGEQV